MVSKVIFVVLLGAALAFAKPLTGEEKLDSALATVDTIVNEEVSTDSTEINAVDVSVTNQPLENVTEKNKFFRFIQKHTANIQNELQFLKEKGSKIIKKGKEVFMGGKELYKKVKQIFEEAKKFINELKLQLSSKEVEEIIDSIKRLFADVKDTGSDPVDELKSAAKDIEEKLKHNQEPTENKKEA